MDEEIDLRKYLEALTKRWKWIVILSVIAAVTAAIVSFLVLQPIYEASALVLITRPRYQLRFDPRLETLSDIETTSKAYPTLAKSDDLLLQVLNSMDPPLPENKQTLQKLRRNVNARAGADPSLLQLEVTSSNPERAAHIANTWADQYVEYVNELYGRRSGDVLFFTEQLDAARDILEEAEDALIDHEALSQQAIIETRLTAKTVALSDYLNAQHELSNVIKNARVLRQQLDEQPASASASMGDDLTALLLEIQGLSRNSELPLQLPNASEGSLSITENRELPVQLQIASEGAHSTKTVKEQADLLNNLITALEIRLAEIKEQEVILAEDIPPLQEALQKATTEKERLTREWEVADGTFITLANKVEEARISAQDETGEVQLASKASVPTQPISPNKLMNIAAAGFLGVLLGILAALFIEYWQSPRQNRSE